MADRAPHPVISVLVFTDIVKSVDLKSRIGDEAARPLFDRHKDIVQDALKATPNGNILQDTGDGFFIRFDIAPSAVKFALRLQHALARERWDREAIKVRIGIHVGHVWNVESHDRKFDKLYGRTVDLTQRVMSLAQGGQVLMTREVRDMAWRDLREHLDLGFSEPLELQWLDHGTYVFNGFDFNGSSEPIEVFEVGEPGVAPLCAPVDSEKARKVRSGGMKPPVAAATPALAAAPVACRLLLPDGSLRGCCVRVADSFAITARSLCYSNEGAALELSVADGEDQVCRATIHLDLPEYRAVVLRLANPFKSAGAPLAGAWPSSDRVLDVCGSGPAIVATGRSDAMRKTPRLRRIVLDSPGDGINPSQLLGGAVSAHGTGKPAGVVVECTENDTSGVTCVPLVSLGHLLDLHSPAESKPQLRALVILSENERTTASELRKMASLAIGSVNAEWKNTSQRLIGKPRTVFATEAVETPESLAEVVKELCLAEIAIFDVTNYEPAIMLLIGIRAVVRRGVSILSMGGDWSPDAIANLPFNIKDANLVFHAAGRAEPKTLWRRISSRIKAGVAQMHSWEYLDLPAYDAVRRLPPGERSQIPIAEGILALASFNHHYVKNNWKTVHEALDWLQDTHRREGKLSGPPEYGVVRSVDLDSPRLVSQAIYGFIRRASLCVVDWTGWRPNVFFEFGVRLAASREHAACIAQEGNREMCRELTATPGRAPDDKTARARAARLRLGGEAAEDAGVVAAVDRLKVIAPQGHRLFGLFNCLEYPLFETGEFFSPVFQPAEPASHDDEKSPATRLVREVIAAFIDVRAEPVAMPIHRQMLESALQFCRDDAEGISGILFPENPALRTMADESVKSRMIAAWRDLTAHYSPRQVADDLVLRGEYNLLKERLTSYPEFRNDETFKKQVQAYKAECDLTPVTRKVNEIKDSARASRNLGMYDDALTELDRAIRMLEGERASAPTAEVDAQLADCYGLKGGTYRRADDLENALKMYQSGLEYERALQKDSYNLSNTIALSIMRDGHALERSQKQLQDAIALVDAQIKTGGRQNQWWAYADLGLFYLLVGRVDEALRQYARFQEKGAGGPDYDTTIGVLDKIHESLQRTASDRAAIVKHAIDYLSSNKPGPKPARVPL